MKLVIVNDDGKVLVELDGLPTFFSECLNDKEKELVLEKIKEGVDNAFWLHVGLTDQ